METKSDCSLVNMAQEWCVPMEPAPAIPLITAPVLAILDVWAFVAIEESAKGLFAWHVD